MRAALFEEFGGEIAVTHVPDPAPGEDDVVVQVFANGICRSDWHGWMGHDQSIRLPHVPGHECSGVVVAKGRSVGRVEVGNRVIVPFSGGCGVCESCSAGLHNICDNDFQPGFSDWGAFAEFVRVGYADVNLIRLPDAMTYTEAASLGCRFMTAFGAIIDRAQVQPSEFVAVFGCGGVGLSAIMIAASLDAIVIAIDIRAGALKLAEAAGASSCIHLRGTDRAAQAVRELTAGGAHVSVEATGSPAALFDSIGALRKRGRHVQIGLMEPKHSDARVPMDLVISRELQILGSHGLAAPRYPDLLNRISTGRLSPGRLVNRTVSLDEAPAILMALDSDPPNGVTIIDRF